MNRLSNRRLLILSLALIISLCAGAQRCYAVLARSGAPRAKKADAPIHASAPVSVHSPVPPDSPKGSGTLFPGVHAGSVTAVSVCSQERRFDFRLDPDGDLSVNGSMGDHEIFLTLLEQITQLPVSEHSAFSSDSAPILTLTLSSAGAQQTVHFYPGENRKDEARIVFDAGGGRHYRRTDAWRVGTLLMTCEGTRIQDESGNEIPAD